jgi:hypothetical protein
MNKVLLRLNVGEVMTLLLFLISPTGTLHSQLTKDSIYSVYISPYRIRDVEAVQPQRPSASYFFVFVEETGLGSRILWKVFSNEADLWEAPVILYSDTGSIRHPHFADRSTYENGAWNYHQYFYWEHRSGGKSAIKIMKIDSSVWSPPATLLLSPFEQTELSVGTSLNSKDVGLAWVEDDSVTYVQLTSGTMTQRRRLKLTGERTCRNPTVFTDDSKAVIVWEERDTTSILAFASIEKADNSITVDTLSRSGDNILPRFVNNPVWGPPILLWSRRDTTAYNLYYTDLSSSYHYHQPITEDSIGANYPGSVFNIPIVWKRGLSKSPIGNVFCYHRVAGDSQAVVRSRNLMLGYQYDEYWTTNELTDVNITQGSYFYPLVFWVEKNAGSYSLKARPSRFYLNTVERSQAIPTTPLLLQNYPNPFNSSTTISYDLPARSHVTLKIFNVLGQEVATLVNGNPEAGRHQVRWDAAGMASGVYLYRLKANAFIETRKLILLR